MHPVHSSPSKVDLGHAYQSQIFLQPSTMLPYILGQSPRSYYGYKKYGKAGLQERLQLGEVTVPLMLASA
jgi:hypothetical protein